MTRHKRLLPTLLIVLVGASGPAVGDPKNDRIEMVRRTYRPVPTEILGLTQPLKLFHADMDFDSERTRFVIFEDAAGKRMHATLSGKRTDEFPNAPEHYGSKRLLIGYGGSIDSGRRVLIRGPEESAVYGLLIRWFENPVLLNEKNNALRPQILGSAEFFLRALDHRYAQSPE